MLCFQLFLNGFRILDLFALSPVASCVRRSAKCELTAKGGLGEGRGVLLIVVLLDLRVGLAR